MKVMHKFAFVVVFVALLLLRTTNADDSKRTKCFEISTNATERDVFNFKARYDERLEGHIGDIEHYLLDMTGTVIVTSNSSNSLICVDDETDCHFLFLTGNGFFNITSSDDDDDDDNVLIAEGELYNDSPKLLQMGDCPQFCGNDYHQLTFIGKANDKAPTLYDGNNNAVVEGLFDNSSSVINKKEEEKEKNIVFKTTCILPNECYKLMGSALYIVSNSNNTAVAEGSTYHGYESFGQCNYRCKEEHPLLAATQRGQDILLAISSISGTEALRNVQSPQYMAACWLIHEDARQLSALDYNIIQRYIVAVVFYSLNGEEWYRNFDFLTAQHECSWNRWVYNIWFDSYSRGDDNGDGIHCDPLGHVTGIILDSNNLEGTMPAEIVFLIDAEYLSLADNFISGRVPLQLGTMRKLRQIGLDSNALTGSFPESISDITTLETLYLDGNMLSGPLPSYFQGDLEVFAFAENIMTGTIPNDIGEWTSLHVLWLYGNHFSGTIPQGIENLTALEQVKLEENKLKGKIPPGLLALPNLEEVWLNDNLLTGSIPNYVAQESPLYMLYLENNYLTGTIPPDIASLQDLYYLWLSNNNLSGEIPTSLTNLTGLADFYIERNNLSGLVPFKDCQQAPPYMQADCDTPQKVVCPCCTACHGIFTPYDDGLECSSAELTIRLNNLDPGDYVEFDLFYSGGSFLYNEYITAANTSHTSTTCVAVSGCFYIRIWNYLVKDYEIELFINGDVVLQELIIEEEHTFHFGWSSDGSIQKGTCEDFTLCNDVAEVNSTKRDLVDKLIRVTGTEKFDDVSSPHYQAACRFVTFLQDKEEDEFRHSELLQYFYLSLLYFDTEGEKWTKSTLWVTNTPFCEWHGIKCNSYGVVTSINLPSNKLWGTIPTEIAELRGLEYMTLDENQLSATIPLEIGVKLTMLRELTLSKNRLWGAVPRELSRLAELREIDISQNQLSSSLPAHIGMMENVEIFNFFQNTLSGELPESFYDLTALKVLNLGSNLLYGDASGVENFLDLEVLDLSGNFFTGTVPLGSFQRKLRELQLSGNRFRGSIPASVEELRSLEKVFLYNNQLTGNLPSQVGNLNNLREVSISYNGIRGTLPSEMGRLRNLTLLHLHNNEIEGMGDFFDYAIKDYVTDCGNTFTAPARVECTSCTSCCNVDGDCLRKNITWPGEVIEGAALPPGAIVLLCTVASCLVLSLLVYSYHFFCNSRDFVFCQRFQEKSVYRLVLADSKVGKFLVVCTIALQVILLYIFVAASDFTSPRNDWEFSTSCPEDSVQCDDKRHITILAWFVFSCIVFSFLFKDMFEGCKMMYDSFLLESMKGFLAGLTVSFITVATVETSVLYLYSTGISNTDILKDAVILFFLSDIDEQLYTLLEIMYPSWIEQQNEQISKYLRKRINVASTIRGTDFDTENPNSAESNNGPEESDVVTQATGEIVRVDEENLNSSQSGQNGGEEREVVKQDYVRKLEDKIAVLENKNIEYDNEVDMHKLEICALKSDLKKMQNDHDKVLIDITGLQNDNAKLHNDNVQLRKELDEIKDLLKK